MNVDLTLTSALQIDVFVVSFLHYSRMPCRFMHTESKPLFILFEAHNSGISPPSPCPIFCTKPYVNMYIYETKTHRIEYCMFPVSSCTRKMHFIEKKKKMFCIILLWWCKLSFRSNLQGPATQAVFSFFFFFDNRNYVTFVEYSGSYVKAIFN